MRENLMCVKTIIVIVQIELTGMCVKILHREYICLLGLDVRHWGPPSRARFVVAVPGVASESTDFGV